MRKFEFTHGKVAPVRCLLGMLTAGDAYCWGCLLLGILPRKYPGNNKQVTHSGPAGSNRDEWNRSWYARRRYASTAFTPAFTQTQHAHQRSHKHSMHTSVHTNTACTL
eukprot:366347-Chlamydomonas_euryale.AAC.7